MTTAQLFNHASADASDVPTAPLDPSTKATVQLVTPELATQWLTANTRNRRLRVHLVEQYARDMTAGRWSANFEPVQIAKSGVLLNGQHRLAAIVESGKAQQMLVVTGLDEDVQDTIDVGARRTPGDQLAFKGFTYGKTLAATARLAMQLHRGKEYRATTPEIVAMASADETLQWVVEDVLPTLPKLTTPATLAYCYLRFHHVDPAAAKEFFEHLASLTDLPPGSPILALHKRFTMGAPMDNNFKGRSFAVVCFMIAWNAWRNDETRLHIKPHARQDGSYNIPEPV